MPRVKRNFWAKVRTSDMESSKGFGPRAKDGELFVEVSQRNDGEVLDNVLDVWGHTLPDGTLALRLTLSGAWDIHVSKDGGTYVATKITKR